MPPRIDWTPPAPRSGLMGAWDRFVGPGATPAEEWLQLGGGLLLVALIMVFTITRAETLNWSAVQWIAAFILAFDVCGGVITNATTAAKRWYHRAGQGAAAHLGFVAAHALHLLVVALLFRGGDWGFFVITYSYLMLTAVILVRIPLYLQRAVALMFYCGALLIALYILTPTPGLEWLLPFFYLKLLVSHLVHEAPFAPTRYNDDNESIGIGEPHQHKESA